MVKLANIRERSDVLDVFPKGSRQAVHFVQLRAHFVQSTSCPLRARKRNPAQGHQ